MLLIGNVVVVGFMGVTYMLFLTVSQAISPQGEEMIEKSTGNYRVANMSDDITTPEEHADNKRTIALVEELKTLRHCKRCLRAMLVLQACVEVALASITIQIHV